MLLATLAQLVEQLIRNQQACQLVRRKNHRKCDENSLRFQVFASVAHSVEQLIRNQQVRGSTPRAGSINYRGLCAKKACKPLFHVQKPKKSFYSVFIAWQRKRVFLSFRGRK